MEHAKRINLYTAKHTDVEAENLTLVAISSSNATAEPQHVEIDQSLVMEANGPGIIMLSSGTTGMPKCILLPRRCFFRPRPNDTNPIGLVYCPNHWMGGAATLVTPALWGWELRLIKVDIPASHRAEIMLNAFQNYPISHIIFSPVILREIKELMVGNASLTTLSSQKKTEIAGYFKSLTSITCASWMLEPSIRTFWTDLTGLPFVNMYSSTELGGSALVGVSQIQVSCHRLRERAVLT